MAEPIALIGLDCRFPGAADPDAFWRMLLAGAESVSPRPASRGARGDEPGAPGGFLDDADAFDHAFFGISRADATAMDPQQRLLLQTTWRALEDAGLNPLQLAGSGTGVFVGAMADDWARIQLSGTSEPTPRLGIGAGRSMLANRLSYQLDLRGPSLTVDSACSSALLAVHLAVNSLLAQECDTAVVGGVNLVMTDALDAIYRQAGLAAPDGRCKPFGAASDGIGRAEGVGVVVLRRAADARRDGQLVHALLLGSAVNQDGRSNGIMAPSRRAQREVMLAACRRAGVEPSEVGYVEAHGTGTPIGDLIEARALGDVYGAGRSTPCGIGSVKGNIGHAEGAAGIAGLIKAALALRNGIVPPLATVGGEHPGLALREHGLRLVERPEPLPATDDERVLIGVSSFGMGGSNAHVILTGPPRAGLARSQAAPDQVAQAQAQEVEDVSAAVFTLTAPSAQGLRRNAAAQADALARRAAGGAGEPDAMSVGRVCWTSNRVRTGQPYRLALPAADLPGLVEALRDAASGESPCGSTPSETPVLGFLFTGQGAQYPGMTARLYRECALYRHHLDRASAALRPHHAGSVVELLLSGDQAVHRTEWTQPCVFAVEYALAASLAELGVRPDGVVGHSIGEFAAAVAAEALTLDEAAALVAARATAMGALPEGGGMLAVRGDADQLAELVEQEPLVSLAAVNGPRATVLAGDLRALARLRERFQEHGTGVTPLKVSHAFHSTLMEPVLPEFLGRIGGIRAGSPRLPMFSTVTGSVLAGDLSADYWAAHVTGTVRFAEAAQAMLRAGITHLVELGPKQVLLTLARRVPGGAGVPGLSVLSGPQSGACALAAAAAELYRHGAELCFDPLYTGADRRPTRLLPQVFDDSVRLWRRPSTSLVAAAAPVPGSAVQGALARTGEPADAERLVGTESPAEAVPASVAAVLGVDAAEVGRFDRFYDDLGFDSVMLMELKTLLEERLPALGELSLPEMMAALVSVDSLVSHLDEQLALGRVA
jgi:acyl transferase domain-containing protein